MDLSKGALLKTRIFALIVVLSNAFGNCLLTLGLRQRPGRLALSPLEYILAIFNPWVALGVGLLILWLLSRMALLSWADLSYVLPVTASGYVVSAFMYYRLQNDVWAEYLNEIRRRVPVAGRRKS